MTPLPPPRTSSSPPALRNTLDFFLFERLNALGWNMPLRTFAQLCAFGYALVLPLLLAGSLFGFGVLRKAVQLPPVVIGAAFLLVHLYAGGAYLLREAFSRRRHSVSGSPNEGFFRALDIRARDVFLVYCLARIAVFYGALLTLDTAFLVVYRGALGQGALGLLCVPLALFTLTLAVSVRMASHAGSTPSAGLKTVGALGVACVMAGLFTGRFLGALPAGNAPGTAFQAAPSVAADQPLMLVITSGTTSALLFVAAGVYVIHHYRSLDRASFAIRPTRRPTTAPPMDFRPRRLPLLPVVHRQFTTSRTYPLVRRMYLALLMAGLLLVGVRASETGRPPLAGMERPLTRIAVILCFVMLLGCVELLLATCGPTALGPQFRFAWENMLSQRNISVSAVLYYTAHVLTLTSGVAAAAWLASGTLLWQLPFLGVSVLSATLIAESLTTAPKRLVDGTSTPGVFVACVSIGLALPSLAGCYAQSPLPRLLAALYCVCLLGGGITCIGRRIRTLPLRSAM
ncbi:hypothetical protein [Streptomyces sp. NPDC093097]|uniref:hypothetical protein n=1 Tax=Streptomyces sp. NPDC093097 TaxID=3366027 RepID=UPI003827AFFC